MVTLPTALLAAGTTQPMWLPHLTAGLTGIVCCLAMLVLFRAFQERDVLPLWTVGGFAGLLLILACGHFLEATGWVPFASLVLLLHLGKLLTPWALLLGLGWVALKTSVSPRPAPKPPKAPPAKPAPPVLSVSEERFRLLANQLKDYAVFMLDLEGRVMNWTEEAQRVLGYRAAEIIGQPCSCFYPKEEQQAGQAGAALQAATTSGRVEEEGWRLRQDGTRFRAQVTLTALKDEEGRLCGFTQIIHDITARQQVKEQLYQAQKMEAVGRLAGGVAHDFNNLLTVMSGYTELLLSQLPPDNPMAASLQEIAKASQRAAGLTRQLLIFSRKQILAPQVLDLNSAVTDMDKLLRRLIGEDIELRTVLDPDLGRVKADPGQISQVIMNLAVNARDAMPRGGRLLIQTTHAPATPAAGAHAVLAVTDTGSGMDEAVKAHLFEPFFTTKEQGKGTGLGLATVYGIIQQSGGRIEVTSAPDQGTTFTIFLPCVEKPAPTAAAPTKPVESRHGSETILLVEDEAPLRNLVRMVLTKQGYTILEATNGRHALHVAEQHAGTIDLLVTDLVMPLLGGQELAQQLTTVRPQMKVLFMSGYTDSSLVRRGVYTGEMVLIQKPFLPDQLAAKVREMLDAVPLECVNPVG